MIPPLLFLPAEDENRIDLWVTGYYGERDVAKAAKVTDIKLVFIVREIPLYLACSPQTSPAVVKALSAAVEKTAGRGSARARLAATYEKKFARSSHLGGVRARGGWRRSSRCRASRSPRCRPNSSRTDCCFGSRRRASRRRCIFGTLHSNDPRVTAIPPVVAEGARRVAVSGARSPGRSRRAAGILRGRAVRRRAPAFRLLRRRHAGAHPGRARRRRAAPGRVHPVEAMGGAADARAAASPGRRLHARRSARGGRATATVARHRASSCRKSRWRRSMRFRSRARWPSCNGCSRIAKRCRRNTRRPSWHGSRRILRAWPRSTAAPGRADPAVARHFAQLTKHLVENRSVLMAHRLFMPLREGRVFVAVGALHLYGRKGLLELIRAQGYRIQRVY